MHVFVRINLVLSFKNLGISMKSWIYNEFKQTGINFENNNEVREYDDKYKSLRNYDQEVKFIFQSVKLHPESVILEIGTGTGEHAIRLARQCRKVVACDVSIPMLKYAEEKSKQAGINNIEFINSGFLNARFPGETFDAVISQLALHHLPDFWKSVAINNIARVLKPNGVFYLLDSILSFEIQSHDKVISGIIESVQNNLGERIADEIIVNIRDEYPTYDWIIENLLIKGGFMIEKKFKYTEIMSLFVCKKKS